MMEIDQAAPHNASGTLSLANAIEASMPDDEICKRHGYVNVAMNIHSKEFYCNLCIYVS